jgi:cell shape-determining protein MreC
MNRKRYRSYCLLGIFLLCLFYLPGAVVQGLRSGAGTFSSSLWKKGRELQGSFSPKKEKTETLQVENLLLKNQNETLRHRLYSEDRIEYQLKKLKELTDLDEEKGLEFFKRRKKGAENLLNLELFSLTGKVIRRDHGEWNTTLWINLGSLQNEQIDHTVVGVGRPVLKGPYLIGVIDQVDRHKSRVRLLTDSRVVPSVRAVRGKTNDREFESLVKQVYNQAIVRGETQETLSHLKHLIETLQEGEGGGYFAKGELTGSASSQFRIHSEILRGIGFNYDFGDEENPPLDLRSGKEIQNLKKQVWIPLIKEGDLLVTTGMDGTFPKDLPVAHVTHVVSLKEGSPSYAIEARLCAGSLETLLEVTILPPLSLTEEDA